MKGMRNLLPYLLIQRRICYPEIMGSWLPSRGEAYPELFQPHFSTSCLLCLEGTGSLCRLSLSLPLSEHSSYTIFLLETCGT